MSPSPLAAPTKAWLFTYRATAIAYFDGDTFHLRLDLGFSTYRECRCRLARCDAPELKTPAGAAAAVWTEAWLANAMLEGPLLVQSRALDNYGRPLVEVWSQGHSNLTDDLIASGNAAPMARAGAEGETGR